MSDSVRDSDGSGGIVTVATVPSPVASRRPAGVDQAMREHEMGAMRGFVRLVVVLVVSVAVAVPFFDAGAAESAMMLAGLGVALAGALRTGWVLRQDRLESIDVALFGAACTVGGAAGIYFFGVFSPAPLATIMAVFFFGMQRSPRVAAAIYGTTAVIHGAGMLLMTAGWIDDRGLVAGDAVTVRNRLGMAILSQLVFALVYLLARAVHRAVVDAAVRLEESTRAIAQREALLEEARRELERALEIGGPGRFTEQRLGCWQLGVLCGRGAMGDVYHATHVDSGERAAVKLLHRDAVQEPGHLRRFLREARIANSIDVPNVVRVIDVGTDEAPVPYLAMELLSGTDLAALLRRQRRLAPAEVVELLRQVGRGLDAAHRAGIVHRDLKPQNLFLAETDDGPVWKILDFGVSRLVDSDSSLTRGQAVGTPSYMSPEQARGRDVDHRADLFALGVVTYRALTGRPAFTGREVPQILYSVVHTMPPRPSELAGLPAAVDDVLAVALAKRPDDRFDRAAELAEALEAALTGRGLPGIRARAERVIARLAWGGEGRAPSERGERGDRTPVAGAEL
jgi:eukaryotic-like serine/threonine-protein kinase